VLALLQVLYGRQRLSELEGFSPKVNAALTIMEERFSENVGLGRIAVLLRMHPVSLCQKISNEFSDRGIGLTPTGYLTAIRMREARELLRSEPFLGCKEVAARVGVSERHLRRLFRKYLAISPGCYRDRLVQSGVPLRRCSAIDMVGAKIRP
jgi:transcriptional regulator GlxA family with amidase domain